MLTIKKLKQLIENLPDEAQANAYEGEGCGLQVTLDKKSGWIETVFDDADCNDKRHDLEEFIDTQKK